MTFIFNPTEYVSSRDLAGRGLLMVVYGEPGTQKTRLALTAPEGKPVMLFPGEQGTSSIAGQGDVRVYEQVRTLDQLQVALETLSRVPHDKTAGSTLVIDSLSAYCSKALTDAAKGYKNALADWNLIQNQTRAILTLLTDRLAHMHRVVICKVSGEPIGDWKVVPQMTPKGMWSDVAHEADLVARAEHAKDENGEPCIILRCKGSDGVVAKSRSPHIAEFEKPNLADIISKYYGEKQ